MVEKYGKKRRPPVLEVIMKDVGSLLSWSLGKLIWVRHSSRHWDQRRHHKIVSV